MRAIVRYCFFVLAVVLLGVVGMACAATWSRAYVRMEQDEREVDLFMSHRGQVRWFYYRLFDFPWRIWKVVPTSDSISINLDFHQESPPAPLNAGGSSAGEMIFASSTLTIGMGSTLPLAKGYCPHWWSETIARQAVPGRFNFPDRPAEHIREVQIPYWPALALALGCTAMSGKSVFRDLRSRRRLKSGLCPAWSYDLRATPDCCPECGLMASARA